ncbi:MAG: nitroreductase family protein [Fibrobacter sp.]|nr:nitroreductase family protein [Fibrobacter sp.]
MDFFSETYHESIKYAPKASPDPIVLYHENQKPADRRYSANSRIDVHCGEVPSYGYTSADDLRPVGIYVVLRNRSLPDGVYVFDSETLGKAPDIAGSLVKIGGKDEMKKIVSAFAENELVSETPILYIFTGIFERAVWHFKEAAYSQVLKDVGACVGSILLHAKAKGGKTFSLGGFVDSDLSVTLKLSATEVPLAALAVFPEYSPTAYDSVDEGIGESAYSNRGELETTPNETKFTSRFMCQNYVENIDDLSKCIRIRRLTSQPLPGDEFPLTLPKFTSELYFNKITNLQFERPSFAPFSRHSMDLDIFSSILRWLELGQINLFGAGLLKIWIICFDVMFVYPGVYRYVPVRKSIYMQSGLVNLKKFIKLHATPSEAENASFAILLTADLKEACNLLGERAYRYLQLNAGYLLQSTTLSSRILNRKSRAIHFYFENEIKELCSLPETESILAEILVGK